jgi:3(or 17)beta-hydroxysteroid dehydrogenase
MRLAARSPSSPARHPAWGRRRRACSREGAKVVVADVLEHEGRQVADAIGASARFEPLEVTKEESWAAVVAATTRHFGKLDVLVNNAGISGSAEQDFYSTEAWHRIMAVNATGVFFGIKYAIPAMVANGGGSIVNLSSIAGIIGSEHVHTAYNASKAAVRLMTKSVAVQHAKDKIRVNSVHPGIMPPMRTSGRTADPAVRAERMHVIPLRRPGEVDEVAYAICSWLPMNRPKSQVRKFTWTAELSPYRHAPVPRKPKGRSTEQSNMEKVGLGFGLPAL